MPFSQLSAWECRCPDSPWRWIPTLPRDGHEPWAWQWLSWGSGRLSCPKWRPSYCRPTAFRYLVTSYESQQRVICNAFTEKSRRSSRHSLCERRNEGTLGAGNIKCRCVLVRATSIRPAPPTRIKAGRKVSQQLLIDVGRPLYFTAELVAWSMVNVATVIAILSDISELSIYGGEFNGASDETCSFLLSLFFFSHYFPPSHRDMRAVIICELSLLKSVTHGFKERNISNNRVNSKYLECPNI